MSIQVTLTFSNTEEMLAYFTSTAPTAKIETPKLETKKEAPAPKAEKPKAEPKAETPAPTPTPADTATASPTASSASSSEGASSVDYPTLQKAVFALANAKGRDAVVTLLKDQFKVNSAKELAAEQYADALAAVTAATGA